VGIMGIQIAKAYGCTVVASCSTKNTALVKSLGADQVIDYTVSPPYEVFKKTPPTPPFDVIFDCVGSTTSLFLESEAYLKPEGKFVSTGPDLKGSILSMLAFAVQGFLRPTWLGGVRRSFVICQIAWDGHALPELEKLLNEGKVKPVVDSVYPFTDVIKAYDRVKSGRAAGKVVVEVDAN